MKIKEGFLVRVIAGNIVAVPTGELVKEFPNMITLNKTGKFIFELLQKEDLSSDEIVNRLMRKYKINESRAKEDTEKFVKKLEDSNVLQK